jgi:hypothetical protein
MALIVQDATGLVSGANTYISLAYFKAYHLARGNDHSAFADPALETAIVRGFDHLETRFKYVGEALHSFEQQSSKWPRQNAYDADRRYVNGIHPAVQNAQAEYALRALTVTLSPDPVQDTTGQRVKSTSETVGPIQSSVVYMDGSAGYIPPSYPAADRLLLAAGLVNSSRTLARA